MGKESKTDLGSRLLESWIIGDFLPDYFILIVGSFLCIIGLLKQ
jgi:hypothetical protein